MMWVRGAKEDFDRWANQSGAKGEEHANILKQFREVETADPDIKPDTENMESLRGRQGPLGVEIAGGETAFLKARREVVVSAGAINTPQLPHRAAAADRDHPDDDSLPEGAPLDASRMWRLTRT